MSIHLSLSVALAIVQNTNFMSMLDGKELKKDLSVTIVNKK